MSIYQIQNQKIVSVREKDFSKEKEMHELIEANLGELFGLELIDGEFEIEGYFIDSLAYDPEVKSFVILEYKKGSNFSVVDQGLHYLSLMLNHKANFVLAYITKTNKKVVLSDFDWSQVRVIFVAKSFTQYQQGATNFKDFPIELWEFARYENGLLDVRQIQTSKKAESVTKIIKDNQTSEVVSQVKTYTVEEHFKKDWDSSKELYEDLRVKLLSIDNNLVEDPKKHYIGFKIGRLNVIGVHIHKMGLSMILPRVQPIDLKDPEKRVTYVKDSFKHYGKHESCYVIIEEEDVDYAVFLAKQVYTKFIQNN